MELRSAPLFNVDGLRVCALDAVDVPALQCFFENNPEYFLTTSGQAPAANEAQQEFDDLPPAGMSFSQRWLLGFVDEGGEMLAMASILSDFLATRVWHVGLFIAATALHGSGRPRLIYEGLEAWMREQGALWLRLGVVQGNTKGERFWDKRGYRQTRERGPIVMGLRSNLLRVMVKPLAGGELADYLALVSRDQPGMP